MFDGFEELDVATDESSVHLRRGGAGPPVLLLHGMPETHLMWHRVAPRLAERCTVVAADLRGFGGSGTPPSDADHTPYGMRAVAREQVAVMRALGYDTFAVVGHDRGGRCGYRMALDHPDVVTRLAVLDIVPTGDAFGRADREFSLGFWLWSFLAAPAPVPERLVAGAPEAIVDHMLDDLSEVADAFPADVRAAYVGQLRDPDRIHAVCEQYRAAATLDYRQDEADRGVRRIGCPVLVLWSHAGPVASWYRPLKVWRAWADDVTGGPVRAGHFLPEEAPDETTRHLLAFLG
ncbi:alpha/beta hydrolase [Micromonospora sp. C28SCA-DRY-2]|uniref:alpha/beta fold hydrolase n=1 Tax=Micromonospora sp. C28SCA-DRY-2 TaxID=3059522 RepID=UPI0026768137|nr:alpha/beta hydrolase [Micromonospora sp. C28SCA-DRY-2]MDO3705020.1 alpha/beta hydrolase [Micromonospora sp. C28SCA-DRY-2]